MYYAAPLELYSKIKSDSWTFLLWTTFDAVGYDHECLIYTWPGASLKKIFLRNLRRIHYGHILCVEIKGENLRIRKFSL